MKILGVRKSFVISLSVVMLLLATNVATLLWTANHFITTQGDWLESFLNEHPGCLEKPSRQNQLQGRDEQTTVG